MKSGQEAGIHPTEVAGPGAPAEGQPGHGRTLCGRWEVLFHSKKKARWRQAGPGPGSSLDTVVLFFFSFNCIDCH